MTAVLPGLVDASRQGRVWIDPDHFEEVTRDSYGTRVVRRERTFGSVSYEDLAVKITVLDKFEVDGVIYNPEIKGMVSNTLIGFRFDYCVEWGCECPNNEEMTFEYRPMSYAEGEICETCYMKHGRLRGIGKGECSHGG